MKKFLVKISLLLLLPLCGFPQIGGEYIFQFTNITNSARIASMGGENVSLKTNDLSTVFHNPGLLDSSMSGFITLNYINYLGDINFYYAGYAQHIKNTGNFALGVYYFNYGTFQEADNLGYKYGTFRPSDYTINLSYSRKLDSNFYAGVTTKFIYSDYVFYTSSGIAADLGVVYQNKKRLLTVGTVIRNAGFQLKRYNPDKEHEPLPIDWQIGFSKKVKHAPFRLSFTYTHLEKFDLTYEVPLRYDEDTTSYLGDATPVKKDSKILDFADKFMRHLVAGVEFLPFKNFYVSMGYNYRRREELKLETHPGLTGFSIGVGMRISKFYISYGRALYHVAGASNVFTISTNVASFYNRIVAGKKN